MAYLDERNYNKTSDYIEGNVVRIALPERVPEPKREQDYEPIIRRKERKKAKRISLAFAAFSATAGIVLMMAVVTCISVQTEITTRLENISALEQQLLDAKEMNAQMETQISLFTDITYIYETATVKLGMVPADDASIIYYDKSESEYVRQYEYIPE